MADLRSADSGVFVVDGYIDVSENAITYITLSTTTPVNEDTKFLPETGATVFIEDEDNNSFALHESKAGTYKSSILNLPQNRSYRLKIIRSNEKTYYSEFVKPIITPAIDSVTWAEFDKGVEVYVSTHDPQNNTKYYQWSFDEVWERTVPFTTYYKLVNGAMELRPLEELSLMKTCWVYDTAADLNTGSSLEYPTDVIPRGIVLNIPRFDERLFIRYSITVNQHALSKEAYFFYEILKKNGRLGTFSDPMPSELPRNMYHVGSDEHVVGFMGAYTTEKKRIEILESQLVDDWFIPYACTEESYYLEQLLVLGDAFLPTRVAIKMTPPIDTLIGAVPASCADCRRVNFSGSKGATVRPTFWDTL